MTREELASKITPLWEMRTINNLKCDENFDADMVFHIYNLWMEFLSERRIINSIPTMAKVTFVTGLYTGFAWSNKKAAEVYIKDMIEMFEEYFSVQF